MHFHGNGAVVNKMNVWKWESYGREEKNKKNEETSAFFKVGHLNLIKTSYESYLQNEDFTKEIKEKL